MPTSWAWKRQFRTAMVLLVISSGCMQAVSAQAKSPAGTTASPEKGAPQTTAPRPSAPQREEPDPQQLFSEAQTAHQLGDNVTAARKYQELVTLHPEIVAAHANFGVALAALGRFDEAIHEYHMALMAAPGDPGLLLDLGLAYLKKGDWAAAAAQFAWLHQQEPDDLRSAVLLGRCYIELGLDRAAVALLQPLEAAHADNLELEWTLGLALAGDGQTQEGLKRIQNVADQSKSADAYQVAANLSFGLARFDDAKRNAEAVLRLNPKAPKAHVVLGMISDSAADWESAAKEYRIAMQIDPKDLQARSKLAYDLYSQRKLPEARRELALALAQDPNFFGARYQLALVKQAEGDLSGAVLDLESVVKQSPDWLQPHLALSTLYPRLKRFKDAEHERSIVDRLREQERARHGKQQVINPEMVSPQLPRP